MPPALACQFAACAGKPADYRCPLQVLPWLELFVPSGQVVCTQDTPVKLAPVVVAPVRLAKLSFAPESSKRDVVTLELTRDQVKAAPEYKEKHSVVVLGASGGLQSMPDW